MRIVQVLPTIAFGDAIGNDVRGLKTVLRDAGYDTDIYARVIGEGLPRGTAKPVEELRELKSDDIILYHLSTGDVLNRQVMEFTGKKVIIYHNITPADYFRKYNFQTFKLCRQGLQEAKELAKAADYAIADSEYHRQDLLRYGCTCRIDVLPILIPFEDYRKTPDARTIRKYEDDYTNILFVGRIVPNKKQEDIIAAFYYYKKYINPKSRLILIGTTAGVDGYWSRLEEYARRLELEDVIFTGAVRFDEILAWYRLADVFLCMSEHEGFCVPLLEAMCFDVPVIARDTSAIAGTLGGSGILLPDNDPMVAAEVIHKVVSDEAFRQKILKNQRIRLADFDNEKIRKQFLDIMERIRGEGINLA
ncbi:MAG: glycosyltransferase family 4 protein [Lachnospiraceae bacterium]|nr:glycosyltransferase family 4 protein [Lachnospiraceae bacterium]